MAIEDQVPATINRERCTRWGDAYGYIYRELKIDWDTFVIVSGYPHREVTIRLWPRWSLVMHVNGYDFIETWNGRMIREAGFYLLQQARAMEDILRNLEDDDE
jgi:hypothetical protein